MLKDNVKLLDIDEPFRDVRLSYIPQDIIEFAKKYDLIVDLTSSDVVIFIEDKAGDSIGIA